MKKSVASKKTFLKFPEKVVRKHHEDLLGAANGVIDITVSYDGTWQKRGHSSLYGIGIVIDILTGLIIDYEILSKYCPECTTAKRDLGENSAEYSIWYKSHQEECSENYVGSSNAMEVKAAEILWKRSIKNCGMRYVSILSDGDAKTYQHLSSLNVYDKTPKHSKCPTGSTSWCFYQRALAKNENPMSHSLMKTKLSEQVLEKYFQYIKGL
ncbi:uncharacterized protein TNCV_2067321 [Trichonephila clavipes]|uniref:Mutator-like transposase domain-containing protein n=1 Tax=Trichonephila clavipes TaxID=2585209 RepID=A0A8X6W3C7_TRICX|nr:uncharacterized protein TNCV_2067321 [Trichonephila clavipes]